MQDELVQTKEISEAYPSIETKEIAKMSLAAQEQALSKDPNLHNIKPLFDTFIDLVDHGALTQDRLDEIVTSRGYVLAGLLESKHPMADLKTTRSEIEEWEKEDFPYGGTPTTLIKKAALPDRVGGKENVYTAVYRDLAAIAADKETD